MLKVLGFSSSDDDDFDDMSGLPSGLPVNHQASRETSSARTATSANPDTADSKSAMSSESNPEDFVFPVEVFDSLLEVFNDAQPDFIRKCVDINAQRQYLYDTLNSAFKDYFAGFQNKAVRMADRRSEDLMRRIDAESSELRQQLESARKSLAEAKEQNMSAMRQRRAFNERIRDLEQQVETEKAEKDQYALETKSLLNKLKVAKVNGASYDESAQELLTLRDTVADLQSRLASTTAELEQLRVDVDQKQKALDAALAENKKLEEKLNTIQQQPSPVVVSFESNEDKKPADKTSVASGGQSEETVVKTPARRSKKHRRQSKPPTVSISAIDDSLDTTEWLLPTPPAGSAKPVSSVTDSEFGYHEPMREDPLANDAQLSLFD